VAVWLSVAGAACSSAATAPANIGELLASSVAGRMEGQPVDFQAVVTESSVLRYRGVEYPNLYVQDATGSIRVALGALRPSLKQGDRVEVRGWTAQDIDGPVVIEPAHTAGGTWSPAARGCFQV
jgi:hypothetical protein